MMKLAVLLLAVFTFYWLLNILLCPLAALQMFLEVGSDVLSFLSLQWCNFLLTFSAACTCLSWFPMLAHLPIALVSNNFFLPGLSKVLQKMNIYSYRQTRVLKLTSACEGSWEPQTKEACSEPRRLWNWASCHLSSEPACSRSCLLTICKPEFTAHLLLTEEAAAVSVPIGRGGTFCFST